MEQKAPDFGRFAEPSLLILVSLSDGPKHGYAIMQGVEQDTGGRHDNNGSGLAGHPGESQGRPEITPDSQSISCAACPSSGVPPLPLARSENLTPEAGHRFHTRDDL